MHGFIFQELAVHLTEVLRGERSILCCPVRTWHRLEPHTDGLTILKPKLFGNRNAVLLQREILVPHLEVGNVPEQVTLRS